MSAEEGKPTPRTGRRVVLSVSLIFLLALIPPSLGLFSFFRVDDYTGIMLVKTQCPTFTVAHFLTVLRQPLYEYYRPAAMIVWWAAYLIGGLDPRIYHLFASVFFGLIAVNLYLIGRFRSSDLAGWLSALAFITFAPTMIVSWWISNFGVGFAGLFWFSLGILLFLHLSDHPRVFTPLALLAFTCAFFAKNSFVFLAPAPFLLYGTSSALRTRLRLVTAGLVLVLSVASGVVARLLVHVPALNPHVHLNLLELNPSLILRNLSDYWGLLLYGHSPFIATLGLLCVDVRLRGRRVSRQWILPFLFIIVLIVVKRSQMMQSLGGLLLILYVWQAPAHTRVWGFWIVAGLAQVMFWDVPILGGLMNRFIIEPSAGFALLLGTGLAIHLTDIRAFMQRQLARQVIGPSGTGWGSRPGIATFCIGLFAIAGVYQEVRYVSPTLRRELASTIAQGEIMRDTLQYIVPVLPTRATLYVELPLIAGVEHHSQFTDALIDFNRSDIRTVYFDRGHLSQTLSESPPNGEIAYVLVERTIEASEAPSFVLTKLNDNRHGSYRACIYRLDYRS